MIALSQFNSLSKDEAAGLLALAWRSAWGETLVGLRRSPSRHVRCCRPPVGDG